MKKTISIILIITFLLACIPFNALAGFQSMTLPNEIQDFFTSTFSDYTIIDKKPLYDVNDNVCAYIVSLDPVGYIIFNETDVIECSHTVDYPIDGNYNYYFGPLQIYKKTDNNYQHLVSKEIVSKDCIESLDNSFKVKQQTALSNEAESKSSITPRYVSEKTLPYRPRTYSYNPDNRCGSTALAITLMYYDDHIDSYMVPDWIANADSTGQYFSTLLKPHVEDINSNYGSSAADLSSGADWYFAYRGVSNQYHSIRMINPTFDAYRTIIDGNKPVIVLINSHPTYGNHWVVGYGYYYQSYGTSVRRILWVNDGWGNNGREINFNYVVNLVYFNK